MDLFSFFSFLDGRGFFFFASHDGMEAYLFSFCGRIGYLAAKKW
jgi:hypothetical protein